MEEYFENFSNKKESKIIKNYQDLPSTCDVRFLDKIFDENFANKKCYVDGISYYVRKMFLILRIKMPQNKYIIVSIRSSTFFLTGKDQFVLVCNFIDQINKEK